MYQLKQLLQQSAIHLLCIELYQLIQGRSAIEIK